MSHDLCIARDEIINETIHCVDISRHNDDVPCSQVPLLLLLLLLPLQFPGRQEMSLAHSCSAIVGRHVLIELDSCDRCWCKENTHSRITCAVYCTLLCCTLLCCTLLSSPQLLSSPLLRSLVFQAAPPGGFQLLLLGTVLIEALTAIPGERHCRFLLA